MTGAIFLDRDGTINRMTPGEYITDPLAVEFLPGALDALAFLAKNSGRKIAVLTNQACVGRGLCMQAQVDDVHDYMERKIAYAGGRIDEIYVCPHAPAEGCGCRKPKPGLFIRAARDLGIDLSESVMVGDTATDLRAAWAAGIPEVYLVLTGDPRDKFPADWHGTRTYEIMFDLGDAARLIVQRESAHAHTG